ncbi:uncharacterized protein BP5553_05099 [Venustampulla echinocandica]|uniref:Uncharacterized protein n=1 Tax=Venustampulla echinocandica TaxID=2656787 RepID=A0A370TQ72_9HELO|nr:uncharacterized protein BP5553_05099 [Venustampulla echinocandica]RDL37666.1 hypothetical protein BP5553_05099 [Venustampulla echinocandica]
MAGNISIILNPPNISINIDFVTVEKQTGEEKGEEEDEGTDEENGGAEISPEASSLPKLTPWALRYGASFDANSGWTPISIYFPCHSNELTPEELTELEKIKDMEAFQRRSLNGLTTMQLVDLDAISTRPLKAPNLANAIHPIIRLDRWEKTLHPAFTRQSLYPIGGDHEGDWIASNPVVYSAFEPVMQLVSRILLNVQMTPWFDAFMLGEKRAIPKDRIPADVSNNDPYPDMEYMSFHCRPGPMTQERQDQSEIIRDGFFSTLANQFDLFLGFFPRDIDPRDGLRDSYGHGLTIFETPEHKDDSFISIWLCINDVEGLLDSTINDSERLGMQWFIANTMVHEFMHAIWFAMWGTERDFNVKFPPDDPYFEDEPIAEAGFSMEQAMFGGTANTMPDKPGTTHFGHWIEHWPNIESIALSSGVVMLSPALQATRVVYPVRVSFYEEIHQEEFWDIGVRQFGFHLFNNRNLRVGIRQELDVTWTGEREPDIFDADSAPEMVASFRILSRELLQAELLGLSPLQRKAQLLARSFLQSTIIENSFLQHSEQAATNMRHIMAEASTQGQYGNIMAQQKRYIMEALKSHGIAAKSLANLQKANGTLYPDRRHNLLHWNKGMRTYLNEVENIMRANTPAATPERPLREELSMLERCRMSIVCPPDSEIPIEEIEDKRLGPAFHANTVGNKLLCLQLCSDITQEPSCTLLDACLARLLAAAVNSSISKATRKNDVALSIDELRRLMGSHPELACPHPWIEVLDRWIVVAEAVWMGILKIRSKSPHHTKR